MKLDDAIQKRRSVRKFSKKKVRWDVLLEAIDAALQSPFAGNHNNLHFIIVYDQESKNRLAECAQQDWIATAPFIVAVCSDPKSLEKLYYERAEVYSRQHAGAAIQNFLLKITDLKLASCWIGAYTDDHVKDELNISKDMNLEALLPVGYPDKSTKVKKPRKNALERSINWGKLGVGKKPTGITDPRTR